MKRYFFDLTDNGELVSDPEGVELPSLDAAVEEAAKALPDVVREAKPDGTFREVAFHVRDGDGNPLFMVKVTFEMIRNRVGSDDLPTARDKNRKATAAK